MSGLMVAGAAVRMDAEGRYNLNDLHHAGGGKPKHRPSLWLANQQTQELVNELNAEAGNPALAIQRGGAASGSYGCREIGLAYAAWIAPSFHVRVLRAADAVFRGREQPAQHMQAALNDPGTLRALLLNQADACIRLESEAGRLQVEVDRLAPKVAAFQRLDSAHEAVSITEAAKVLGMKPTQFFAWLSELKWTYRASDAGSWLGHARYCDAGYLEHRLVAPKHSERQRVQVRVTTRGIAQLAVLLERKSLPRSKNPTQSRRSTTVRSNSTSVFREVSRASSVARLGERTLVRVRRQAASCRSRRTMLPRRAAMTSLHTLESKALRHWREFLPSMVARLAEEGQLETRVRHAALTAQQEIRELVHNSGYQEHEAEEVVLPKLILLKPEVDAGPAWERDELDEKERQYQAMMAEPADEDE